MNYRRLRYGLLAAGLLLMPALPGCVYMNIRIPLDTNLDRTELGEGTGASSLRSVLWMVAWGDAGIHAAARQGNLRVIHHADQQALSILGGLYYKRTTIVYGEP